MGRKALNIERIDNPKKKQAWVKQLFPFLQKKGLKNITMDEVAKELNKSKATIYKYFKSQTEIWEYTVQYKLEAIKKFEVILADENTPYLERYMIAIQHLYDEMELVSNLFLRDVKHLYPDIWEQLLAFQLYSIDVLRDYYIEGIKQGIFNDINPTIMVLSDQLFFQALSEPNFLISNGLTIQAAFQAYFEMRMYGFVKRT
ncbi:MAG: TetR/AcrR family transcriptional regulator [Chitinophagales bacterium]